MSKLRKAVEALLDDNAWCDIQHDTAQAILDALAADDDEGDWEAAAKAFQGEIGHGFSDDEAMDSTRAIVAAWRGKR